MTMKVRMWSVVFMWALFLTAVQAQRDDYAVNPRLSKGVLYKSEFAVEFNLHTNGLTLGFNKGKIEKYYKTTYYHVDIGYMRHPKEFRQSLSYQSSLNINNSFTFGKQNVFFLIRGGFGGKRYFSEKARRKGLAVGLGYEFGPTLGILKPYYLVFRQKIDDQTTYVERKYTEDFEDVFLDHSKIQGKAGFFKGFDELKFAPGIHGKAGAHFAIGAFEKYVTAIEVGLMLDLFFQKIPIMVVENNKPYFLNLYLTLQLGKRK